MQNDLPETPEQTTPTSETCREEKPIPLSRQEKLALQDFLYADMQVRLDISSLKRSLKSRAEKKEKLEKIRELLAAKKKK